MNSKQTIRRIVLYGFIIVVAGYFVPKEKNWTMSFSKKHDWPYGNDLLYKELPSLFPNVNIFENSESLYEIRDSIKERKFNILMIQDGLNMDTLDINVLLAHAEKGNDVFISAQEFPLRLLDTLGFQVDKQFNAPKIAASGMEEASLSANFYSEDLAEKENYEFATDLFRYNFSPKDTLDVYAAISWTTDSMLPTMVSAEIGKGRIFLHSHPLAFTNYYLLKPLEQNYISKSLSFLSQQDLMWDEYYKPINAAKQKSKLYVIMSHPSLKWAYYILVAALLIFMFFMSKRKQRAIPLLDSYPNESKKLVETVGSLYFNTADNKLLSDKKIKLFYQYMYRKIALKKEVGFDDKVMLIEKKIGYPHEKTDRLFTLMENIEAQEVVSDGQLKVLAKQINELYTYAGYLKRD